MVSVERDLKKKKKLEDTGVGPRVGDRNKVISKPRNYYLVLSRSYYLCPILFKV